ncbi:exoribonuclease II [Motilimonas pumila]|uniref:Exoribonuclease II n=1 Tax=Motilimonas pumila TaxID=2303987 RepID=A0A418YBK1_9GAMM|nr:exoribonuclease II [Motilimonas pumila]RJG41861.1 exoribonuclease II [Motilimonas pumila]
MFQDNPLLAQLKQQMQADLPKQTGVVKATDRGYGFLETGDKKSIFIAPANMKKVLHGDTISAIIREENDKTQAEPETLQQCDISRLVGRVKMFKGKLQFNADNPLIKHDFLAKIPADIKSLNIEEGDWVVASLQNHSLRDEKRFSVIVTDLLAKKDDHFAFRPVTLAKLGLDLEPPELTETLIDADADNRVDLTQLPFFTIDGETTQDMDDALAVRETAQGFELHVAIADPSAYLPLGSQLDTTAAARGFTIYMPGFNVPMLPREVSDSLCSLQPQQPRAALVCQISVSKTGEVLEPAQFMNANIVSQHKLSYQQVSDFIEQSNDAWQPETSLAEGLGALHQLALARLDWRQQNALLFDDQPDYKFELDQQGKLVDIHAEPRRIAHKMVEEAMVLANICGAEVMQTSQTQGVFNTQAGINPEKMVEAHKLLTANGIECELEKLSELDEFCRVKRLVNALPDKFLDIRLRRMFAFGEFSAHGAPHFAMGLPLYATWTSPLRKYSDLINHRQIKTLIAKQSPQALDQELGGRINEQRKLQRQAENGANAWLYAQYLSLHSRANTVFEGTIMDVVKAGIRVKLHACGAFVFIPTSLIAKDKTLVECKMELGEVWFEEQSVLKQGQTVQVVIHDVNLDTRNFIARLSAPFTAA